MSKTVVQTEKAPAAIGPYSQGIIANCGQLVFISGQIPLEPATMELVTGDVQAQTVKVMENLQGALEAAGCGFADVVRTTIFLKNMDDLRRSMRCMRKASQKTHRLEPVWRFLGCQKDVDVEIDCIAVKS